MEKARLDSYLFDRGFCKSRQLAKTLISDGFVFVNSEITRKPSFHVSDKDKIFVSEYPKYVSRGGYKLEKAFSVFKINAETRECLDIGASTGGFTDCLLQNGAAKVYAVDVGRNQLASSLLGDERVVSLEKTHVKDISSKIPGTKRFGIITVDVSFISLEKVIPFIKNYISSETDVVCLVKPQFEIGKTNKGIVRDKKDHLAVLRKVASFIEKENLFVAGADFSPVKGGDGNTEFLFYIKSFDTGYSPDFKSLVEKARTAGR